MKLPFILSGPILRRVEPTSIYIWITLSRHVKMDAQLFQIDEDTYIPLEINTETKSFKAGEQLYIYLIKISPNKAPFPSCTLLGYNLFFKKGVVVRDLGSYGLLTKEHNRSIVYGNLKYPAFYIDDDSVPTNLLYGSCRKPHGVGGDALIAADSLVEEKHLDHSQRPNGLFFMGDQIYADDVGDPLFPILSVLSSELIGHRDFSSLSKLVPEVLHSRLTRVNARQFLIEHLANFSTGKGDNHLITFGEYAAMYLISWSPEIWEFIQENDLIQSFRQLIENKQLHLKFESEPKKREKELSRLEARYEEQTEHIREFIVTITATRRLMANIPTYMIFDDHDLTDDWNISEKWTETVRNSPLGKYIIGNGLAAYWLFQGWGNDPENFDTSFRNKIENYLGPGNLESGDFKEGLDFLWDYHSWHFIAPTVPKTVFLDTRTQRDFDPRPKPVKLGILIEETTRTPLLISEKGWQSTTEKLLKSGWNKHTPLNIVSPTPVYGMGLIESFLHKYVFPFKVLGFPVQTSFDFDGWKYNGKGFHTFLSQVSSWDPSYVILLSGDVHFSSAVKSEVELNDGKKHSICQFTSSPIHNESFTGVWGLLMKSVLWLNAQKRKEHSLYRSCSETYSLSLTKDKTGIPKQKLWEETINYYSFSDGSIAETKNSIGYLHFDNSVLENTLLMAAEPKTNN
ncbi:hypothetical protein J7E38_10990 [Bacillus sp. ISL-35]|uniref:hypothetical protein n=1 Tax=Bacillus sp. ISL-35 TaxID=2819122 RepID=UPI001BE9743B|nr:hypothetical protein [Bacillus sp. ISL-35]MBT2679530.1 hypothetical protein [Bacillus sp. ISL-35]MBT2703433.1 hypothetical protein [Chryseobacterium sp. ISL-80]